MATPYKEAEGKLRGWFGKDYEGAMALFTTAGAQYKMGKDYTRAGEAYKRAGDCAVKMKDTFAACSLYTDAANAYKKVNMEKASQVASVAVELFVDTNRLESAAKLMKDLADSLKEDGRGRDAVPFYEKAIQYYKAADRKAQVTAIQLALGEVLGMGDDFAGALEKYERVAKEMVGGPLQFQAQNTFLRAMLCRLAMVHNDNRLEKSLECQEALERYLTMDIYLKGTREADFLQLMVESVTDCDIEKFECGVSLLQDINKLNEWSTHVLLVVKHNMESLT